MSLLQGMVSVLPGGGAKQAEVLAHREASRGGVPQYEVQKCKCHFHMLQSTDCIMRHDSPPR